MTRRLLAVVPALVSVAIGLVVALGTVVGVALGAAAPAAAHGPASTLVRVSLAEPSTTTTGPVVQVVARIALQQLDDAYGSTYTEEVLDRGAEAVVADHADELADTVATRTTVGTTAGSWPLEVGQVSATTDQGQDAVRVVLTATGPVGAGTDVDLTWGTVTDVVVTHDVYIGGVDADGGTSLVAILTRDAPTATLSLDDPGALAEESATASTALWSVGFHHFREGADHLLFLGLLALGVARHRAGWAVTARRLAVLTLTFTAAHSLSLALAVLGVVALPSRWVEVAIAATIVLAAAHVVRPRLPFRGEVVVTALFGLVHGFGFAGTLAALSVGGTDLAWPLLTFNLGLEAAQLAALALVILPLLVIARSTVASAVLAGAVGVAALSWVVERAVGVGNVLQPVLDVVLASPERLALILAVGAALVLLLAPARRGLLRPVAQAARTS